MVSALTKALGHSVSPPTPGCVYILCLFNILKYLKTRTMHLSLDEHVIFYAKLYQKSLKSFKFRKICARLAQRVSVHLTHFPLLLTSHEHAIFVTINKLILIIIN